MNGMANLVFPARNAGRRHPRGTPRAGWRLLDDRTHTLHYQEQITMEMEIKMNECEAWIGIE
jgi:hypothetical protein